MSIGSANPGSKIQRLKAALAERGLAPRKIFGQNFMLDANFAAAIAREAAADRHTLLIETGPGTGCLTQALLDNDPASRILAIEIDRGLAALLRETFADAIAAGRLTVLEGDALASKHRLSTELVQTALEISARENRPRRILCSNLPYNIATPLLVNLALDAQDLCAAAAVATIQLELAERMFARAGTEAYGALSVLVALRAEGRILRRVGNEIFWPRPNVESALIRLDFRNWSDGAEDRTIHHGDTETRRTHGEVVELHGEKSGLTRAEAEPFQRFLQKLFSQRRKTLRAALKPQVVPPGIPPDARAEDLAPETLLALFRAILQ